MKRVFPNFGFPAPLLALSALPLAVSLLLAQPSAAQAAPNLKRACISAVIDSCNASVGRYTARLACASTALTQCLSRRSRAGSAQQKGGRLSPSPDRTSDRKRPHSPDRWQSNVR